VTWVLIDGHNALAALGIRGRTHEEARGVLLRRVAASGRAAIVFFDARNAPPGVPSSTREYGVHVRYCRFREADAAIIEAVRGADEPGALVVVTNDREVAGRCAQLGARASGVEAFFGGGGGKNRRARGGDADPPPRPPPRPPRGRVHFKPEDFGLPDFVDLEDPDLDE